MLLLIVAAKRKECRLIIHVMTLKGTQWAQPRHLNVTDRQTDGQTTLAQQYPLCTYIT